jgi:hypothetical protein
MKKRLLAFDDAVAVFSFSPGTPLFFFEGAASASFPALLSPFALFSDLFPLSPAVLDSLVRDPGHLGDDAAEEAACWRSSVGRVGKELLELVEKVGCVLEEDGDLGVDLSQRESKTDQVGQQEKDASKAKEKGEGARAQDSRPGSASGPSDTSGEFRGTACRCRRR